MSKLELFLVLFHVGYLNTILTPKTNKVLKDPLNLGEFMRWVGCWLYMACWVGIPKRRDWFSVTPPVMHRVTPFCLNKYMSCRLFDEKLASLRYSVVIGRKLFQGISSAGILRTRRWGMYTCQRLKQKTVIHSVSSALKILTM